MGLIKKLNRFGHNLTKKSNKAGNIIHKGLSGVSKGLGTSKSLAGSVHKLARQYDHGYNNFMGSTGGKILRAGLSVAPGGAELLALGDDSAAIAHDVSHLSKSAKNKLRSAKKNVDYGRDQIEKLTHVNKQHDIKQQAFAAPASNTFTGDDDDDNFHDAIGDAGDSFVRPEELASHGRRAD